MRLPSGLLTTVAPGFLSHRECYVVGCLAPEERCTALPIDMHRRCGSPAFMLIIEDPEDAYPDYTPRARTKISANQKRLSSAGVEFTKKAGQLLASDDDIVDLSREIRDECGNRTLVLDITCLPKRYFCLLLKRLILSASPADLVVTYTGATRYIGRHLAEDPMPCDHLPGFSARPPTESTVVLSVGFECLNLLSLLEIHGREASDVRFILPFPPNGEFTSRTWHTLFQVVNGSADAARGKVEVVAAWDAEQVYTVLERLDQNSGGLILAPFGPKPHSLGMALFAMKHDAGLYYTQPKSYHPDYSLGSGPIWAYVAKWNVIPCFDRLRLVPTEPQ